MSTADVPGYFSRLGAMRVSDLHLKVGCLPTYRKDGILQPIKGDPLTPPVAEALIFSLLSDKEIVLLRGKTDCSTVP